MVAWLRLTSLRSGMGARLPRDGEGGELLEVRVDNLSL